MRIEERKQAAEAGPTGGEPGSAAAPLSFAAVVIEREKAAAAAAELQRIAEKRVTAAIEEAAAFFASGNSAAAGRVLEQLPSGIEESPQGLSVEALARAFKAADAVVKRGKEAQEKAERRLAAVLSAPAPVPSGSTELPHNEGLAEAEAARESAARLADFIRRLSGYEVWDKDIAAAELSRISDADPRAAELSRAIVALADHVARGRVDIGTLRFLGTVSTVIGERILADVAASGASVGGKVRIYRSGGSGARGRELAQATITDIRGNTAGLRITTPPPGGSFASLEIAPLDTIYLSE